MYLCQVIFSVLIQFKLDYIFFVLLSSLDIINITLLFKKPSNLTTALPINMIWASSLREYQTIYQNSVMKALSC